ncbi:uncharacterized protein FFB14_03217 [Fusarium fujikuroi]|nr:uncharacterized protein FFB14_03217 [Fusarium fujikuroi]
MTDRPDGSRIPVEVVKTEEVMSVTDAEDVSNGSDIEPEDSVPESVCALIGETSKLDKSDVVPGLEAIMVCLPVTDTLSILIRRNKAKERLSTGGRCC